MRHATENAVARREGGFLVNRPFEGMFPTGRTFDWMLHNFWNRPFYGLADVDRPWTGRSTFSAPTALDVYVDSNDVVVKAELPGVTKEGLDVELVGSTLTIRGEKKAGEETADSDYILSERTYGSFTRRMELPTEVKAGDATASFKNGVLEIRIPKAESAKSKAMHIRVN